jgi:hypothetical protein
MSIPTEVGGNQPQPQEAGQLARELARALRRMVEHYQQRGPSPQEALAKAQETTEGYLEGILGSPADQIGWYELEYLGERDPDLAARCWENIKQAALDELQTGHRAAAAVEGYYSTPWRRAQFLAIRKDLLDGWQPRNGVERQLTDVMSQAKYAMDFWAERLSLRASLEVMTEVREVGGRAKWLPPRLDDAAAIEQAAAMVDRFSRIYLRTLRALQDLRRHTPVVVVQNAGQVNVGQQHVILDGGRLQVSDEQVLEGLLERNSLPSKQGLPSGSAPVSTK